MSVRDFLNKNPALITIGAVVLLILCLGFIVNKLRSGSRSLQIVPVYFYDLNTEKLFLAESTLWPPIETESGPTKEGKPAGVKAQVYTCGECPENLDGKTAAEVRQAGAFIAFLEQYTPQAKVMIEQKSEDRNRQFFGFELMESGEAILLRSLKKDRWYKGSTHQGMQMRNMANACGKGSYPRPCAPPYK